MENKYKVSEFAALLGIVPKTVYKMIEREEIITVTEKVNNRNTTLIVCDTDRLEELKKVYFKDTVNNGKYYNNLTDNNSIITDNEYTEYEFVGNNTVKTNNNNDFATEVIDRIITLNDGYNEQIKTLNEELITVKSQQLLLEDKASRESTYLREINELKAVNDKLITDNIIQVKRLNRIITVLKYSLIVIITLILISLSVIITVNYLTNNDVKEQVKTETVEEKGL